MRPSWSYFVWLHLPKRVSAAVPDRERHPLPLIPQPSLVCYGWGTGQNAVANKTQFKYLVTYPLHVHHLDFLTKWTWRFRHQRRGPQKAVCCRVWKGFICGDQKEMFGAGMERKDPLEGSLLGSGRKACTRAQHSASTLLAGRSVSSQTWPGLSLSQEEVPSSSFSPTHRLKPQLKHEIEETSSKLSPVWGYQNLWHPVTGGPPGWREFEEGRKSIFLSPLLKQFDFSWNIKTFITYVNNV